MEVRTDNSNEEVLGKVLEEVPTKALTRPLPRPSVGTSVFI